MSVWSPVDIILLLLHKGYKAPSII